jgi:hypothetical protein
VTLERVCDTKAERREKLKENREIFAMTFFIRVYLRSSAAITGF